jgi:hypothetical protein
MPGVDAAADEAGELDDLGRVLGYVGAAAADDGIREVASDIYELAFWTPAFCAAVVRAAEAVGFTPDPDDPVPGHEVSLAAISPALFHQVEVDIGMRVWPQLQQFWPLIEYRGLRDAFVIRYRADEQESLQLHQDVAQVSATVRLNAGFEGAELFFPRQGYDNGQIGVGRMIAWPSLVTHPHEARPLRSGTKYGLTVWCELPDDLQQY